MCTIDGCARPLTSAIHCSRHHYRFKRYGDPLAPTRVRYATPEESFAARTEQRGDCLIWTGTTNGTYGLISVGGGREKLVHRYVWERDNGPIPAGMWIDHRCRTVLCARTDHLRLASRKQNAEHLAGAYANNRSSGVRGVSWDRSRGKWLAYVGHNGKVKNLGRFDDLDEAAAAARDARLRLFTHNDHDRLTS